MSARQARSSVGGAATARGVGLEGRAVAWLASHALAHRALPAEWAPGDPVTAVGGQTARTVDDIGAMTEQDGHILIQSKQNLHLGTTSTSRFADVTRQVVNQAREGVPDDAGHVRSLDPIKDRLVILVDAESPRSVRVDLAAVVSRLATMPASIPFADAATNKGEHQALRLLLDNLRRDWQSKKGVPPSSAELRAILRPLRIVSVDLVEGGRDRSVAEDLLRTVLHNPTDESVRGAWNTLAIIGQDLAERQAWTHPAVLIDDLRRAGYHIGPHFQEDERRRQVLIRAFGEQYRRDQVVRFKEARLSGPLFELYTDLELRLISRNGSEQFALDLPRIEPWLRWPFQFPGGAADRLDFGGFGLPLARSSIEFLHSRRERQIEHMWLKPYPSFRFPSSNRVRDIFLYGATTTRQLIGHEGNHLLIGAPGQGKSTVTQYLCQCHRSAFLSKPGPDLERPFEFRLPFRILFPHLSQWLLRRDPYVSPDDPESLPQDWRPSLESLLVHQIRVHAARDFSLQDLDETMATRPVLLVCDALDEIVDKDDRDRAFSAAVEAITRWQNAGVNLQVIFTMRPGAVDDELIENCGMPFAIWNLEPMDHQTAIDYAQRWIRAQRDLPESEGTEILRTLQDRLTTPEEGDYLGYLAQNPMQLSILLELIGEHGLTVPHRRTLLYREYFDTVLRREAPRSPILEREQDRRIILELHEYLAWVIQSEFSASGAVSLEQLQELGKRYLEGRKYALKPDKMKEIFDVSTLRVGALIARRARTFEFEVQPLREYFVAQYLYHRLPRSPDFGPVSGGKRDRLVALVEERGWQNVLRFFAGSFAPEELGSLADWMTSLVRERAYSGSAYRRLVAFALLGDQVFDAEPEAMRRVVNLICQPVVVATAARTTELGFRSLSLAATSGRTELAEWSRSRLTGECGYDHAVGLAEILRDNADIDENADWWRITLPKVSESKRTDLFGIGRVLDIFSVLNISDVRPNAWSSSDPAASFCLVSMASQYGDQRVGDSVLAQDPEAAALVVESALSGRYFNYSAYVNRPRLFDQFLGSLNPTVYMAEDRDWSAAELERDWAAQIPGVEDVAKAFRNLSGTDRSELAQRLAGILDAGLQAFGFRLAFGVIAAAGACVQGRQLTTKTERLLFDSEISGMDILRQLRRFRGSSGWWREQLGSVAGHGEHSAIALVSLFSLAPAKIIEGCIAELNTAALSMSFRELGVVMRVVPLVRSNTYPEELITDHKVLSAGLCINAGLLLSVIATGDISRRLYHDVLSGGKEEGVSDDYRRAIAQVNLDCLESTERDKHWWDVVLGDLKLLEHRPWWLTASSSKAYGVMHLRDDGQREIARRILREAIWYERQLVATAETVFDSRLANSNRESLVHVAARQHWFSTSPGGPGRSTRGGSKILARPQR